MGKEQVAFKEPISDLQIHDGTEAVRPTGLWHKNC
jgi:hypothetical protein